MGEQAGPLLPQHACGGCVVPVAPRATGAPVRRCDKMMLSTNRRGSLLSFKPEDDPDRELFANLWKQQRLWPPFSNQIHGRKLRRWSYFMLSLVLYELIYIPMQIAFRVPVTSAGDFRTPIAQIVLQYLIDILFVVDILIRFKTMFVSPPEEGSELIIDGKLIAQRYRRKSFALDVLACFPRAPPSHPCRARTRPPLTGRNRGVCWLRRVLDVLSRARTVRWTRRAMDALCHDCTVHWPRCELAALRALALHQTARARASSVHRIVD